MYAHANGVLGQEGYENNDEDDNVGGVIDDILQNDSEYLLLDAEVAGHHVRLDKRQNSPAM